MINRQLLTRVQCAYLISNTLYKNGPRTYINSDHLLDFWLIFGYFYPQIYLQQLHLWGVLNYGFLLSWQLRQARPPPSGVCLEQQFGLNHFSLIDKLLSHLRFKILHPQSRLNISLSLANPSTIFGSRFFPQKTQDLNPVCDNSSLSNK